MILKRIKNHLLLSLTCIAVGISVLVFNTVADMRPLPTSLTFDGSELRKVQVFDRHRVPLTVTYENRWNLHFYVPLHRMPLLLQQSFVMAEDHRFYRHHGVDWLARWHALSQNLRAGKTVRGASTISEQVVRMLHPRPRTLWSRWIEGWEAARLEQAFSKADILEFYLNQIPFAARRRGVAMAAHYFFDRDLDTLSRKEMLTLAVMVRAPSRLDLHRSAKRIQRPLAVLADRMLAKGLLDMDDHRDVLAEQLIVRKGTAPVEASQFIDYIFSSMPVKELQAKGFLQTTLDAELQQMVQNIVDGVVEHYKARSVKNGAVLVIDHRQHEILAWVNSGRRNQQDEGSWLDAVLVPRQPGSSLKPFLYAVALENGWTAATLIEDGPLSAAVGSGLHPYHNYSRTYYGPVRLRKALGNSLNTPALRTIRYIGTDLFLERLKDLGFESLRYHPDFYGDGLALGNGEVTLYELVRAYAALADHGRLSSLRVLMSNGTGDRFTPRQIFSDQISSLIGDILSDPDARSLEFGQGGLMRLPVQTAVKTGTSNDYRDAWALGYNFRYTVGVWMGNLDGSHTDGVSGATGPALILRSVFNELNKRNLNSPLYMSPFLVQKNICPEEKDRGSIDCARISEWFISGSEPQQQMIENDVSETPTVSFLQPTNGLHLARDPRIPDEHESFRFALSSIPPGAEVNWFVNGARVAKTATADYLWPIASGRHQISASIHLSKPKAVIHIEPVVLYVR